MHQRVWIEPYSHRQLTAHQGASVDGGVRAENESSITNNQLMLPISFILDLDASVNSYMESRRVPSIVLQLTQIACTSRLVNDFRQPRQFSDVGFNPWVAKTYFLQLHANNWNQTRLVQTKHFGRNNVLLLISSVNLPNNPTPR
jgi:hypothetical protein